jgi:hypothetical protein
MRGDFILPAVLAAALVAMTIYAKTGAQDEVVLQTTPIQCSREALRASLREVPEASGAAMSRQSQVLWVHNDSAEPYVFAVAPGGSVRGRVRVAGASVFDWEAVTTAPCGEGHCLFVGDIGDNNRRRPSITVYRAVEPRPGDSATADAAAIEGVYPEGPQDAEAMFVAGDHLYIVTKGEGAPVRLYRFPSLDASSRQTLQLVTSLTPSAPDKSFRITDAAISPDHRWVALRSNDLVLFFEREALLSGGRSVPLAFDARPLQEPQGEGVAWADASSLYLAGEGQGAGTFTRISCNLPS